MTGSGRPERARTGINRGHVDGVSEFPLPPFLNTFLNHLPACQGFNALFNHLPHLLRHLHQVLSFQRPFTHSQASSTHTQHLTHLSSLLPTFKVHLSHSKQTRHHVVNLCFPILRHRRRTHCGPRRQRPVSTLLPDRRRLFGVSTRGA